jgi:hypothetical protein
VESYRENIDPFSKNVTDRNSFSYLEADSWLFDNENLISVYEDVFGKGSVNLINYETSLKAHGDICVSLLDSMQLSTQSRTFQSGAWLNASKVGKNSKS